VRILVSFKRGNPTTVLLENNEERYLTEEETLTVQECHVEALDPKIDDLINISDLNEMSILHNLRMRYRGDVIYTNISSILISVNPFKQLPLYGPTLLATYRDGIRGKDPHIFAVAYNAYHNLMSKAGDQSVVCSGESGKQYLYHLVLYPAHSKQWL
jgi:myosin heavy subunit